jgi:hypothetical protein
MLKRIWFGVFAVLFLPACATVQSVVSTVTPDYNEFSSDAMLQAAIMMEQGVIDGVREPELPDVPGINMDAPEIKQALRSRAARVHLVQEILFSGHSREQQNGKVAIIRSNAYKNSKNSKQKDRDALFIISENRDRDLLYSSIEDANSLSPAGRSAVVKLFAKARVQLMPENQKYQDESGDTRVKQ